MKEICANIWDFHKLHNTYIGITTNGFIKKDGKCVMGAGIAKQARDRLKNLDYLLGVMITLHGNHVYTFGTERVFSFPVKHNWWEDADLALIEQSCRELKEIMEKISGDFYLPRPGCQNGRRTWEEVKPILLNYFENEDRLIICDFKSETFPISITFSKKTEQGFRC